MTVSESCLTQHPVVARTPMYQKMFAIAGRLCCRLFHRSISMTAERNNALPRLQPYTRCTCGSCGECRSNEHWDRVFAKFETRESEDQRGRSRSPISDL